jgi:hypothetical protein
MTDATASGLFFLFLAVCLGFVFGWVCGEQVAFRYSAEDMVEDLRERLEEARAELPTKHPQLQEIRGVLNDIHKHILAVSKALQKPAS